jgi:hypothetical protein
MSHWNGRTPTFQEWKEEHIRRERLENHLKPAFSDNDDAWRRYQFLINIGFFTEETKIEESESSVMKMLDSIFKL